MTRNKLKLFMKLFFIWIILTHIGVPFIVEAHHKIDNPVIKFSDSPEITNFFFEWRGHINIDRKKIITKLIIKF